MINMIIHTHTNTYTHISIKAHHIQATKNKRYCRKEVKKADRVKMTQHIERIILYIRTLVRK